jgi:hypothetical protein
MIYGWEDYDFWLALIKRGREVVRLEGRYFHYRVSPDSMVRTKEKWQKAEMFKRIYQHHSDFIGAHIDIWINLLLETQVGFFTSRLYIDCGEGVSDENSVTRSIESGRRRMTFPLSQFNKRCSIRFDPVDSPACLELCSVELQFEDSSELLDSRLINSNALYRLEDYFMFDSSDPQIFFELPGSKLQQIKNLAITVDLKAVAETALRVIIDYQKAIHEKYKSRNVLPKLLTSFSKK